MDKEHRDAVIDATENANACAAFVEAAQLAGEHLETQMQYNGVDARQLVKSAMGTQAVLLRQALAELDTLRAKLACVTKP